MKHLRIDAVGKQAAGFAGEAGEMVENLGVGGQDEAGDAVEAGGEAEDGRFDAGTDGGAQDAGEQLKKRVQPESRILVHIGVPGGDERDLWNLHFMGEGGGEHPDVPWAADVDEGGREDGKLCAKPAVVPGNEDVEAEAEVERDAEPTFAKLHEGDRALGKTASSLAGPNDEQRYLAALSERDELPAYGRDAIDLVVGVGAEGDPGRRQSRGRFDGVYFLPPDAPSMIQVFKGRGRSYLFETLAG